MARTQDLTGLNVVTLTLAATLYPIYGTQLFVKSFTVQSKNANAGIVTIYDTNGNPLCELSPGFSATIYGDNMDNGTSAKIDISSVQASSANAGDQLIVSGLEGL